MLVSKWVPQQDILAHPNLKLFITHGGLGSFQETLCYQKPVVTIPVLASQPQKAVEAKRLGFGEYVLFDELTEDKLVQAVNTVLHDPKYTMAAQTLGSVANDQITRPLDGRLRREIRTYSVTTLSLKFMYRS